jgi:hypothetical protein
MKATIAQIINSDKALNNLLEQKLPLGISIQLGKVVQEIEPVFKRTNEARMEVLKQFGAEMEVDGNSTGQFQVTPENQADFEVAMKAIFEDEIELNIVEVDPERLPEACLTGKDAIALSWLWKKET